MLAIAAGRLEALVYELANSAIHFLKRARLDSLTAASCQFAAPKPPEHDTAEPPPRQNCGKPCAQNAILSQDSQLDRQAKQQRRQRIGELLNLLPDLPQGLSQVEADARLIRYGPNDIRPLPPPHKLFFGHCKDISFLTLFGFSVLGFFMGNWLAGAIAFTVLLVTAVLSAHVQYQSEQKHREYLNRHQSVLIRRDGKMTEIEPMKLVPGDTIYLRPGDIVPAEVIALRDADHELLVREMGALGQYHTARKQPVRLADVGHFEENWEDAVLQAGSVVVKGTVRAVVLITGPETRYAMWLGKMKNRATRTEQQYGKLSRILSLLAIGGFLAIGGLILLWSGSAIGALRTSASVASSVAPGGFTFLIALSYLIAIRRTVRKHQDLPSLHHADRLEDARLAIMSEIALTERLQLKEFYSKTAKTGSHLTPPISLLQSANLFARAEDTSSSAQACHAYSLYDKAIHEFNHSPEPTAKRPPSEWEWVDYTQLHDHGLTEMRTFRDGNGRLWDLVRGPAVMVYEICDSASDDPAADRSHGEGYLKWLEQVQMRGETPLGYAWREHSTDNASSVSAPFHFIGAISFAPEYMALSHYFPRLRDQHVPVVVAVGETVTRNGAFWDAIGMSRYEARAFPIAEANALMDEDQIGKHGILILYGDDSERLDLTVRLQERFKDVCFIGCHDQERAYFGAAWMAIEQGVLRGVKEVVEALEEAKDARSKLSRASGIILTGNGAEAIYSLVTGLGGAHHALSPINVNMLTNLIGSISLVTGGQRHRETSHMMDIGQLQRPILSQGIVSGLISVAAYGIGYWLQPDPLFAGTFAFATLILSQLFHTWQWGAKSHANNLSDLVAERTLVVGLLAAAFVLGLSLYIPLIANTLNLVPLGLNDWLAAAAVASTVGPITVKIAYPLWEAIKGAGMGIQANASAAQTLQVA